MFIVLPTSEGENEAFPSQPPPPPPPSSMQCCAAVRATIWKQEITSLFFKVAPVKDSVSTILSPIVTQVRIYGLFLTPVKVESTSFGFFRECLEGEWGLPEVNNTGKADLDVTTAKG